MKSFDEFAFRVKALLKKTGSSEFVVFPELFTLQCMTAIPGFETMTVKDFTKASQFTEQYIGLFSELAEKRNQNLIAGSHLTYQDGKYYNICYIFTPEGKIHEHKKTHIFPAERDWFTEEGNELEPFSFGEVKVGVNICYEAEIPECSRIMALKGADIIFCPSCTFTEHGFWRVRNCAQARAIENQVYFVHGCGTGDPMGPIPTVWGRSSILSPCDKPWQPNGIVAEAETNQEMVVNGSVDINELYVNREKGAATTYYDRNRRSPLYEEISGLAKKSRERPQKIGEQSP